VEGGEIKQIIYTVFYFPPLQQQQQLMEPLAKKPRLVGPDRFVDNPTLLLPPHLASIVLDMFIDAPYIYEWIWKSETDTDTDLVWLASRGLNRHNRITTLLPMHIGECIKTGRFEFLRWLAINHFHLEPKEAKQRVLEELPHLSIEHRIDWLPAIHRHFPLQKSEVVTSTQPIFGHTWTGPLGVYYSPFKKSGINLLQDACRLGRLDTLVFLHHELKIEQSDVALDNYRALALACDNYRVTIISYLFKDMKLTKEAVVYSNRLLSTLCGIGSVDLFRLVVECCQLTTEDLRMLHDSSSRFFLDACENEKLDIVRYLSETIKLLDTSFHRMYVVQALNRACKENQLQLARYLHRHYKVTGAEMKDFLPGIRERLSVFHRGAKGQDMLYFLKSVF